MSDSNSVPDGEAVSYPAVSFFAQGQDMSFRVTRRTITDEDVAWFPSREAAEYHADRRNKALPKGTGA